MVQSNPAKFLHAHNHLGAWWFKVKIKPKVNADALLPRNEAPDKYCLSKLLEISMHSLWEALIVWDLAKKKGKQGNSSSPTMDLSECSLLQQKGNAICSAHRDLHTEQLIKQPKC
jgi:hypothetical protein